MVKKSVAALAVVGVLVVVFAMCPVSAVQLLAPRSMPFGVVGSSPVVDAVQQTLDITTRTYSSQQELESAARNGDVYGGYVPGSSSGTLLTVPAKRFFGEIYLTGAFEEASKAAGVGLTTTKVVPLPTAERTGAVVGLLLPPTVVGGYMVASLLYSTSQTAAAPGRMGIAIAFSAVVAVITGVIAGPLFSLDLVTYDDEASATQAMDRGEIYGALVTTGSEAELSVVSTISDISPIDIAKNFEEAAGRAGTKLTTTAHTPTPLAPKDPFALVPATVLVALLVGGYMSAAMLTNAVGTASVRWRGLWLLGFSALTGLAVDLAVTYWLDGFPADSFWVAWPILSAIILVVALFTAVLRRVLGPAGVVVTLILILQFGNPSSGDSNGAAYLPSFWNDIGPLLPPRNAYLLLRNTLYFDGNGIGQPLTVLAIYAVIAAAALMFLDRYRSPELEASGLDEDDAAGAATVAIPVGPLP